MVRIRYCSATFVVRSPEQSSSPRHHTIVYVLFRQSASPARHDATAGVLSAMQSDADRDMDGSILLLRLDGPLLRLGRVDLLVRATVERLQLDQLPLVSIAERTIKRKR